MSGGVKNSRIACYSRLMLRAVTCAISRRVHSLKLSFLNGSPRRGHTSRRRSSQCPRRPRSHTTRRTALGSCRSEPPGFARGWATRRMADPPVILFVFVYATVLARQPCSYWNTQIRGDIRCSGKDLEPDIWYISSKIASPQRLLLDTFVATGRRTFRRQLNGLPPRVLREEAKDVVVLGAPNQAVIRWIWDGR